MPHTPGPWKLIYGGLPGDDGFAVGSDNAAAKYVKITAECWPCSVVNNEHRDELLANACLIAAAPELLAACRKLVGIWEESDQAANPDESRYELAFRIAGEAIAKAEGTAT